MIYSLASTVLLSGLYEAKMQYFGLNKWPELYVDYVNNFLTVAKFAEHYGMSEDHAGDIVAVGRATDNYSQPLTFTDEEV